MKTPLVAALTLVSLLASSAIVADDTEAPAASAMKARLTKGYTKTEKDGTTFYCRKHMPLGTRLPTRVCYTMAQLVEQQRLRELERQKLGTKQVQRPTDDRCGASGASRCGM